MRSLICGLGPMAASLQAPVPLSGVQDRTVGLLNRPTQRLGPACISPLSWPRPCSGVGEPQLRAVHSGLLRTLSVRHVRSGIHRATAAPEAPLAPERDLEAGLEQRRSSSMGASTSGRPHYGHQDLAWASEARDTSPRRVTAVYLRDQGRQQQPETSSVSPQHEGSAPETQPAQADAVTTPMSIGVSSLPQFDTKLQAEAAPAVLIPQHQPAAELPSAASHADRLDRQDRPANINSTLLPLSAVPAADSVTGSVVKVLYHRQETGFHILSVKASDMQGRPGAATFQPSSPKFRRRADNIVAVKGVLPAQVAQGQRLKFEGHWHQDKQWGLEFRASSAEELEMVDRDDIVSYLAGAALPGVGPLKAEKIVSQLGADTLDILNGPQAVTRLCQCPTIGKASAAKIKKAWDENKGQREAHDLLRNLGIKGPVAHCLVQQSGTKTEQVLRRDPYTALRYAGGDFSTAELVAHQVGVQGHDMLSRGELALTTALAACTRPQGHTHTLWSELSTAAAQLLCTIPDSCWRGSTKLIEAAERLCRKKGMVAEAPIVLPEGSAAMAKSFPDAEPPYQDLASPTAGSLSGNGPAAKAAPSASQSRLTAEDALVALEEYLVKRVPKVGPAAARNIISAFGASNVIARLNSPEGAEHLQTVSGIGVKTAPVMKAGWDANRPGLPPFAHAELLSQLAASTDCPDTEAEAEDGDAQPAIDWVADTRCYAPHLYEAERDVADLLSDLAAQKRPQRREMYVRDVHKWMARLEQKQGMALSEGQREAVLQASDAPVLILTGGPGCGKTTATATIVRLWRAMNRRIGLAAPTGRAAQKVQETCKEQSVEAFTVHRLLKFRGRPERDAKDDKAKEDAETEMLGQFEHHGGNPLELDALLVDEASMLDIQLGLAMLRALPKHKFCQLVLVGDADQLAPVGPGTILEAAMRSGVIPIIDLREVFRQAAQSAIVTSAHAVLQGSFPVLARDAPYVQAPADAHRAAAWMGQQAVWLPLIASSDGRAMEQCLINALSTVREGQICGGPIDLTTDVLVIAPMRRGPYGVSRFNTCLQAWLNPPTPSKHELPAGPSSSGKVFRLNDRVMQIVNDYDNNVYNGDLGFVRRVDVPNKSLTVEFPPQVQGAGASMRRVDYAGAKMRDLTLAWATTVHKAQGGESPIVVLLLSLEHGQMLTRRLLYTALTRAQHLVVLAGSQQAISRAVANAQTDTRLSQLPQRLRIAALARSLPLVEPQIFLPANPDALPASSPPVASAAAQPASGVASADAVGQAPHAGIQHNAAALQQSAVSPQPVPPHAVNGQPLSANGSPLPQTVQPQQQHVQQQGCMQQQGIGRQMQPAQVQPLANGVQRADNAAQDANTAAQQHSGMQPSSVQSEQITVPAQNRVPVNGRGGGLPPRPPRGVRQIHVNVRK